MTTTVLHIILNWKKDKGFRKKGREIIKGNKYMNKSHGLASYLDKILDQYGK